jgi:hypothetical protein
MMSDRLVYLLMQKADTLVEGPQGEELGLGPNPSQRCQYQDAEYVAPNGCEVPRLADEEEEEPVGQKEGGEHGHRLLCCREGPSMLRYEG